MRPIHGPLDTFSFPKVTNQLWTENFSDQFTSHMQDISISLVKVFWRLRLPPLIWPFFKLIDFIWFITCTYVCATCVCLLLKEARKGCCFSWDWNYRQSWVWVLETNVKFPERAASAPHHWATEPSLQPSYWPSSELLRETDTLKGDWKNALTFLECTMDWLWYHQQPLHDEPYSPSNFICLCYFSCHYDKSLL